MNLKYYILNVFKEYIGIENSCEILQIRMYEKKFESYPWKGSLFKYEMIRRILKNYLSNLVGVCMNLIPMQFTTAKLRHYCYKFLSSLIIATRSSYS